MNLKEVENKLDFHRKEFENIAFEFIKESAISILSKNHQFKTFINAMGSWFFVKNDGSHVDFYNLPKTGPVLKLNNFYLKWDQYAKITGEPVRIDRIKGELVIKTDW